MANLGSPSATEPSTAEHCLRVDRLAASLMMTEPALRTKICRAVFCGPEEANSALAEAIKFMWLAADTEDGPLTPSHRVDLAWHELILFTRAYQQLCEDQFGKFIHHQPADPDEVNHQPLAKTVNRYQRMFGVPPDHFWGTHQSAGSTCGACESSGE
jgi:hypothetical protein